MRDVVKSDGSVVKHLEYNAFGELQGEPTEDLAFLYTGKLFDTKTGLQWNINRWYDNKAGRWISEDPVGFNGGDKNIARYVANQPSKRIDPNGLSWVKFCIDVLEDVAASVAGAAVYDAATTEFCEKCKNTPDCDSNPPQPVPTLPPEDKSKYCMYHNIPYEPSEGVWRPMVKRGCERVCAGIAVIWPCINWNGSSFYTALYSCEDTSYLGTEYNWKFDRWGVKVEECNAPSCGCGCTDLGFNYFDKPAD